MDKDLIEEIIDTHINEVLDFTIYWQEEKIEHIIIDFKNRTVKYEKFVQDFIKTNFLFKEPTIEEVVEWLEDRCFPRTRFRYMKVIEALDLYAYDPIEIVKKTHGLIHEDYTWIKFKGQRIKYDKIKLRD